MRINNLADEIIGILRDYTEEIEEGIEKAKEDVAKDTVKDLKKTSPKNTGDYRKGWTKKKVGSSMIIYNKTNYQLTHLLEYGHANRDGSRTAARVHIKPAEEKAVKDFIEATEKVIQRR